MKALLIVDNITGSDTEIVHGDMNIHNSKDSHGALSSGKSSFINYILGRPVQVAGVAPTDDTFTVILPGPQDNDQDGPALIGDPDLGFSNLRQFGPTLIRISCWWIRRA